jgi:hypothetical protein
MAKKEHDISDAGDTRSDEEVLSEGPVTVKTSQGDFEVKPWTFGTYHKVAFLVENMISDLEKKGIDPDLLFTRMALVQYIYHVDMPMQEGKEVDPVMANEFADKLNKETADLIKLFSGCAVQARPIIMETCGLTDEQVDALDAQEAMNLFVVIIAKNEGVLKNVYGLFEGQH